MLFILASIAFFLTSIRSILLWTYVWQKNGYRLGNTITFIQQFPRKKLLTQLIFPIILVVFFFLYGVVIFVDSFSFWYQVLVTGVFVIGAVGFVKEILGYSLKHPVFSFKALLVCFFVTFFISLFFMIPLVDRFLWLIFLNFFIPILVALWVALLAFPSEVYEDYFMQRIKGIQKKNKDLCVIAISGKYSTITKKYIYAFLAESLAISFAESTAALSIGRSLKKAINDNKAVLIFEIPSEKDEIQKLSHVLKIDICIFTSDIQDKEIIKRILSLFSRKIAILSFAQNTLCNTYIKKKHKKLLLYGMQKSSTPGKLALFGYNAHVRNKKIRVMIKVGKERIFLRNIGLSYEALPHFFPALFVARKLGVSLQRMQKCFIKPYFSNFYDTKITKNNNS